MAEKFVLPSTLQRTLQLKLSTAAINRRAGRLGMSLAVSCVTRLPHAPKMRNNGYSYESFNSVERHREPVSRMARLHHGVCGTGYQRLKVRNAYRIVELRTALRLPTSLP